MRWDRAQLKDESLETFHAKGNRYHERDVKRLEDQPGGLLVTHFSGNVCLYPWSRVRWVDRG